ncbi:MAG: seryl-tRNA synthetase [Phenylobacterium sp.]|jgi:seryl-tRNA synthetase
MIAAGLAEYGTQNIMLNIDFIRKNGKEVQEICKQRGLKIDVSQLLALDQQRRKLTAELEGVRAKSNQMAAQVKKAAPEDKMALIEEGKLLKKESAILDGLHSQVQSDFQALMMTVPNTYDEDTPFGHTDEDNVELEQFGTVPEFDFEPKDHIVLGNALGMDFDAATRIAGAGFPLLKGAMARLEMAVLRFTQDQAMAKGFMPVSVPLLARPDIFKGLGFNPRRNDEGSEIFSLASDDLYMAGTAEIALVGQYANEILDSKELPINVVAMTPCFRREGASGRRDAGLYRNKMFHKVELVTVTTPEESANALQTILDFELDVFKQMGIYFRVIRICAGDLGAPAFKKYDVEGWMLGRGKDDAWGWGELTSCSNCTEYQARRLKIRHKSGSNKPAFVHTVNGTGITTRALIPLLEQNQNEDGSIRIPEVLRPYLNGDEVLRA